MTGLRGGVDWRSIFCLLFPGDSARTNPGRGAYSVSRGNPEHMGRKFPTELFAYLSGLTCTIGLFAYSYPSGLTCIAGLFIDISVLMNSLSRGCFKSCAKIGRLYCGGVSSYFPAGGYRKDLSGARTWGLWASMVYFFNIGIYKKKESGNMRSTIGRTRNYRNPLLTFILPNFCAWWGMLESSFITRLRQVPQQSLNFCFEISMARRKASSFFSYRARINTKW